MARRFFRRLVLRRPAAVWSLWLCGVLSIPRIGLTQAVPRINPGGVVNAASFAEPISPRSLVTIFGSNLAASSVSASGDPLPTELAGTSVTFNGIKAGLLFVSPGQINLRAPSSLLSSVVVTTTAGSSAPQEVPVYSTSPGVFTTTGTGCGHALALNVQPDGAVSVNSPSNSAAPGDFIALYGTGLTSTFTTPTLRIDGICCAPITYAGPAPALAGGVDQLNFEVLPRTRDGCAVPVSVQANWLRSPSVSVSIRRGRGPCQDEAPKSYGEVQLIKTISSGTGADGAVESFIAAFPSGPGSVPPQPEVPFFGFYAIVARFTPVSRTCPINGQSRLSAGAITVAAKASGKSITIQPSPAADGFVYQQALPTGFIAHDQYGIGASGGPVSFQAELPVGSPIQIQTPLTPGTRIPSTQPFIVRWTGGDAGTLVKVSLESNTVMNDHVYGYADAAAGSFTIQPFCTGGTCRLPAGSSDARVVVEVLPDPAADPSITAVGLTQPVRLSWMYRYVFSGLAVQ